MIKVKEFTDKFGQNNCIETLAAEAMNEWLKRRAAQYQIIDIKYNTIYHTALASLFASILIVYNDDVASPNVPNEDNIESHLGGCEKDILRHSISESIL